MSVVQEKACCPSIAALCTTHSQEVMRGKLANSAGYETGCSLGPARHIARAADSSRGMDTVTRRLFSGASELSSVLVMSNSADKCPVDHRALAASSSSSSSADKCPVDHTQRSSWSSLLGGRSQDGHGAAELPDTPLPPADLPVERETSSIPRLDGSNWVYPSQAQFYAAMARKNHNPQETDMKVVVPIHNAVNERAWMEIMKWEAGQGGDRCGGVKLVSFKGRPNDLSPRARWYSLLGYVLGASLH